MKKLISMGLAVVMCLSLAIPALAVEESNELTDEILNSNSIDEALLQRGIPQQILDRMSDDTKEYVYNNPSLEYGSSMCMSFDEETGEYSDLAPASEHIPDGDLDLTFSFYYDTKDNKINTIEVTFDYNWNKLPVFRWSDPIAVSWDDAKLRFVPDSFEKKDYVQYRDDDTGILLKPLLKESSQSPLSTSEAGISWEANLGGHSTIMNTVALYGNAVFKLEPQPELVPMKSIDSTIHAKYVHPQVAVAVSIAVPDFGSFTVNGTGLYQSMAEAEYIKKTLR